MADLDEFLYAGEWRTIGTSSWVTGMAYRIDQQELDVEFVSGAICRYYDVSVAEAEKFATARSFKKPIWSDLYYRDYTLLRSGG